MKSKPAIHLSRIGQVSCVRHVYSQSGFLLYYIIQSNGVNHIVKFPTP